jgi:hypothetical protein
VDSVALAHLFAEDGVPPDGLWQESLVASRRLEPFPTAMRTLDALHLASLAFLHAHGQAVQLTSCDERMNTVARQLRVTLYEL